jgi:hypothetical protein
LRLEADRVLKIDILAKYDSLMTPKPSELIFKNATGPTEFLKEAKKSNISGNSFGVFLIYNAPNWQRSALPNITTLCSQY